MNNKTITKFLILGLIIVTISPAAMSHSNHGNDANVRAMASMLASMQHFPSEEDQVKLQEILDQDSSCLLYTSPSPRDATLSRMPSSA